MNIREFEELTDKIKNKNSKLFGLDSDCVPTIENIEFMEKYYGIIFPNSYKDFLLKYGGGYFAYTVVYSLDEQSPFYIRNNVGIEFVNDNSFFPVIDFETGDVAGFKISNGMCEELIAIYNHEKGIISDLNMDLFDALAKYGFKLD